MVGGQTPGDRLQITGAVLYKVRIRNTDAKRGKSGGYRVIYYVKTEDDVILVTLYSKTEQSDIQVNKVQEIIDRFQK